MTLLVLLVFATVSAAVAAEPPSAIVIVPVADVWSRPLAAGEAPLDDLRETQVLSGEQVLIHQSSGSWTLIEAVEQPEFTHHDRWEGYPGWVLTSVLKAGSGGTPTVASLTERSRDRIIRSAKMLEGETYVWGGLSSEKLSTPSSRDDARRGVDCSGLVHRSYRTHGSRIPRDAHDQWMKALPVTRRELKPADLIFSAKASDPKKITHVALYAGDGQILEAPQAGMAVRMVSFTEKYGKPLPEVESGDRVNDRVVYFGSFFQK